MPEPKTYTPKEACDKIVAYLPELGEYELSRISSTIKALRDARKNKTQMKFDIPDDGEKKNPS